MVNQPEREADNQGDYDWCELLETGFQILMPFTLHMAAALSSKVAEE